MYVLMYLILETQHKLLGFVAVAWAALQMAACMFAILFLTLTWILFLSYFTSSAVHSHVQHHG